MIIDFGIIFVKFFDKTFIFFLVLFYFSSATAVIHDPIQFTFNNYLQTFVVQKKLNPVQSSVKIKVFQRKHILPSVKIFSAGDALYSKIEYPFYNSFLKTFFTSHQIQLQNSHLLTVSNRAPPSIY